MRYDPRRKVTEMGRFANLTQRAEVDFSWVFVGRMRQGVGFAVMERRTGRDGSCYIKNRRGECAIQTGLLKRRITGNLRPVTAFQTLQYNWTVPAKPQRNSFRLHSSYHGLTFFRLPSPILHVPSIPGARASRICSLARNNRVFTKA